MFIHFCSSTKYHVLNLTGFTIVYFDEISLSLVSGEVVAYGDTSLQVYVVIGRHVDKGARLSELLVAMINVAPDGGKWS